MSMTLAGRCCTLPSTQRVMGCTRASSSGCSSGLHRTATCKAVQRPSGSAATSQCQRHSGQQQTKVQGCSCTSRVSSGHGGLQPCTSMQDAPAAWPETRPSGARPAGGTGLAPAWGWVPPCCPAGAGLCRACSAAGYLLCGQEQLQELSCLSAKPAALLLLQGQLSCFRFSVSA